MWRATSRFRRSLVSRSSSTSLCNHQNTVSQAFNNTYKFVNVNGFLNANGCRPHVFVTKQQHKNTNGTVIGREAHVHVGDDGVALLHRQWLRVPVKGQQLLENILVNACTARPLV